MFRTDCLEISIALCTSTLYYSTFAWPELALKLSLNLENASINATRHMYSASNHCSKNIEYLLDNTRGNWNSSLHGTYPAYSTFREKWFNHNVLPQDIRKPLLPTSFALPQRLFSCASLRLHTTCAQVTATVACFEAVHMARGLAVPDFLRQITEER